MPAGKPQAGSFRQTQGAAADKLKHRVDDEDDDDNGGDDLAELLHRSREREVFKSVGDDPPDESDYDQIDEKRD